MSVPRWIWQCDRVIPSKNGAGRKVRREVLRELQRHHWSKHDVFSIHLALEEALVNAIEHGNEFDPEKQVRVCCQLADDLLRIEVTDEGPGFDPAKVPDPTDEQHLENPGGRGVLLMRRFMDRVEYSAKGNAVVLEKRRTADPAE